MAKSFRRWCSEEAREHHHAEKKGKYRRKMKRRDGKKRSGVAVQRMPKAAANWLKDMVGK